jgi:hypothetical protein
MQYRGTFKKERLDFIPGYIRGKGSKAIFIPCEKVFSANVTHSSASKGKNDGFTYRLPLYCA